MTLGKSEELNAIPTVHPLVASSLRDESLRQRDSIAESARLVVNRGIRDRADATRDVLAAGAQDGGTWTSVSDLVSGRPAGQIGNLSPESAPWWRALGQITLLHAQHTDDEQLAAQFYAVAHALDGHRGTNLIEYWSLMQSMSHTDPATAVKDNAPAPAWMPRIESDLFALDRVAATVGRESGEWLTQLNARVFETRGLAPVRFQAEGRTLFDRVESMAATTIADGPLVSVIMTTFQRSDEVFTSIRSILAQSWSNLELLVVDDASGPEFEPLLKRVERLDPRVRVIRQAENAGAYFARNSALAQVSGDFVTFQDDDDWSHPQRIERQIAPMLEDELVHSTLSRCVRTSEDLRFRTAAAAASTKNASSLMFRTRDLATLGGFDTVRKAGDTEFIQRLCVALPGRQVLVEETLALVRQTQGSLSRTDFGPGWSHPSRQEYWDASAWWHQQIALGAPPKLDPSSESRAFPAPRRFLSATQTNAMPSSYDLVLVGDFGSRTPWLSRAWNFLQIALEDSATVGIIHLSDPAGLSGRLTRIAPEVRQLLHDRVVDRILPTDEVSIGSLFVTNASIVELQDPERWSATCARATVLAETQPAEAGTTSLWSIRDVVANIQSMFGMSACQWVASDESVREALTDLGETCAETTVPFFIHEAAISVASRLPHPVPVIGRCSPPNSDGWPCDVNALETAYPTDGSIDVRIFGDDRSLRGAGHRTSEHWLLLRPDAGHFSAFIQQLDFYVYYGDTSPNEHEYRALLATMAAGRVVLVDARYAHLFGGSAVSCTAEAIASTVFDLCRDRAAYASQVARAREAARSKCSPSTAREALQKSASKRNR